MPIRRRPDRPWSEPAAAIGTDIFQHLFDARYAKRAFIRTDPRLERIRRQRLVAMFACGSEFEHTALNMRLSMGREQFLEPTATLTQELSVPLL